jgi:hypothetical protein
LTVGVTTEKVVRDPGIWRCFYGRGHLNVRARVILKITLFDVLISDVFARKHLAPPNFHQTSDRYIHFEGD